MTGGCLCGTVRYEAHGKPLATSLCHCGDCRRASGAPCVAWTFFRGDGPTWTHGQPGIVAWAGRERTFCSACGSPLSFRDPGIPNQYEVTTCTLDDPARCPPHDHNWVVDRLPWFDTTDATPRHSHNTPP